VTALRLVWRDSRNDDSSVDYEATIPGIGLKLAAFHSPMQAGWIWEGMLRDVQVLRHGRKVPGLTSHTEAMRAAEAAALSLLVEALGAYATSPPGDTTLHVEHDCTDEHLDAGEYGAKYPDDAIALGVALVSAGAKARKEKP
jgi:hypothetical protein